MQTVQIRPNRLEVSDRFPMLGFTLRNAGAPVNAEIVLATSHQLFRRENAGQRNRANFFSSRSQGNLTVQGQNSVYMVPIEALTNFVGAERLYFGLAVAPSHGQAPLEAVLIPDEASPFISLRGLSGRSLRANGVAVGRPRMNGSDGSARSVLDWAGDAITPGLRAVEGAQPGGNGGSTRAAPAVQPEYNDGFGALPSDAAAPPATLIAPVPVALRSAPMNGRSALRAPARAQNWADDLWRGVIANTAQDVPPISVMRVGDALSNPAIAAAYQQLPDALKTMIARARAQQFALAVGPQLDILTGTGGVGVVFDSDGQIGVYAQGSTGIDSSNLLATLESALLQLRADIVARFMVVSGGIAALTNVSKAVGATIGEEIVGGAYALFDANLQFVGIALGLGLGFEFEIGEYLQKIRGFIQAAAQAGLTRAQGLALARARRTPRGLARSARGLGYLEDLFDSFLTDMPVMHVQPLGNSRDLPAIADAIALLPSWLQSTLFSGQGRWTIGVGRELEVGPSSVGAGIAIDGHGDLALFYYGDTGIDLSDPVGSAVTIIGSLQASYTASYLVLDGPMSSLSRLRKTIETGTLGEVFVGGASALFGEQRNLMGAMVRVGAGVELNLGQILDKVRRFLPQPVREFLGIALAARAMTVESDFLEDTASYVIGAAQPLPALRLIPLADTAELAALRAALLALAPLGGLIGTLAAVLPEVAQGTRTSIAFGFAAEAAILRGRVGCVFGRDGRVALYCAGEAPSSLAEVMALFRTLATDLSVSAELIEELTLCDGDLDGFGQLALRAGVRLNSPEPGVPVGIGLHALYDSANQLRGAALELGIGVSLQIHKVQQLTRLLAWLRALPVNAVVASGQRLARSRDVSSEEFLRAAESADPLYAARLRELLADGSLSNEQLAGVVAFLEPSTDPPPAIVAAPASGAAGAMALANRLRARRRGARSLAVTGQRGGVSWELQGRPEVSTPAGWSGTPSLQSMELVLEDWPTSVDGTALPIQVTWMFDPRAGAAGTVELTALEPREGSATTLHVQGSTGEPVEKEGMISIPVTLRYEFASANAPVEVAISELRLHGDGTFDRVNRTGAELPAAATPTATPMNGRSAGGAMRYAAAY